jgi:hypothetical protein
VADKIHEWMKEMQEIKSKQEGVDTKWMLPKIEFMSKKELSDFEAKVSLNMFQGYERCEILRV